MTEQRNIDENGVCLILIGEKNRISLFFVESPDFFSWVSRFSFTTGWQVCYISDKTFSVTDFFVTKKAFRRWEGLCDKETSQTLEIAWRLIKSIVFQVSGCFKSQVKKRCLPDLMSSHLNGF